MKNALIITAYQDVPWLIELLKIYSKYFRCYVHIDKKTKLNVNEIEEFSELKNVFVCQKYIVNWGSYKHILAIKYLLENALNDGCQRFSVISANTLPVKNPEMICNFFDKNREKIFMEVKKKGELNNTEVFDAFEYRYSAYFFQHIYNLRSNNRIYKKLVNLGNERKVAMLQRKINIRKKVDFNYKGYVYGHFSEDAVIYVLNYLKEHPDYIRTLKYCFVGEEFFFQNILMESELRKNVIENALIFDIWSKERGYPAELVEADLDVIQKSGALFARKISYSNNKLFEQIRLSEKF